VKRRVYITGSKGQISLELRNYLSEKDIKVIILSRSKPKLFKNESHTFFDFTNTFHVEKGYRNEVLHLAHDFTDKKIDNANINYIGAKNILKSFKNHTNKRFIFFSTLDLKEPCTLYQKQKMLIEEIFGVDNSLILRLSFVFSKDGGINKVFSKISFFPIFIPRNLNSILPIKNEKIPPFLFKIIQDTKLLGLFCLVGNQAMNFKYFLNYHHGVKAYYLNNKFFFFIVFILKFFPFKKAFYFKERILGLIHLKSSDLLTANIKTFKI